MRIHHLNCGSMRQIDPVGGSAPAPARAVCHCLLVETDRDGLVLVETGLGTPDVARPEETLSQEFLGRAQPVLDVRETALHQVAELGFRPEDVRHIVLSHLDLDHAGGLPDFPWAQVHLREAEHRAAMAAPGHHPEDRVRYRPAHWAHRPHWVTYPGTQGDPWFGFDAVRPLKGLDAEILLVPLGGHTLGHSAIAVPDGDRWLLHCGDAYYFHGEIDPDRPYGHPGMDILQQITEVDRPLRLGNHARLRELVRLHGDEVSVFSAHDPWELQRHLSPRTRPA
ncbi:Metallo-beta-lactamase superfamily protein [Streptosporangium canum]|uniref:Metallo-beta-lactamase superfamily protein n=1 Tax=Streptosporangium canum TaxID=324952 RepID=A0A1I4EQW4_9ACTN|nr:MBL fold metallo-hydrolase [Streptosporangium canum]SFL07689.1 Metallo-beta-lactamase superfamily protein [Streptosporangium canum]